MTTVTFVGDYFVLSTSISNPNLEDSETIIDEAASLIQGYYGWDIRAAANDIEVEV
jgi:hypothetical protein